MTNKGGSSGKKKGDLLIKDGQAVLVDKFPAACEYIGKLASRGRMKASYIRFEASKFIIEQVLGKAKPKRENPQLGKGIHIEKLIILAQQRIDSGGIPKLPQPGDHMPVIDIEVIADKTLAGKDAATTEVQQD